MVITILRKYELEAAHRLTAGVPEHHKCRRPHGHRYIVTIGVGGEADDEGMLVEYGDLDRVVWPILRMVDHNDLNTLGERCSTPLAAKVAENPTVEHLCMWLRERLALVGSARTGRGLWLDSVRVEEDSSSAAEWRR